MAIASSTDDDPAGLTVVQIGNLSADGDGNIERPASPSEPDPYSAMRQAFTRSGAVVGGQWLFLDGLVA